MPIITFLDYQDFVAELKRQVPLTPIRVQAYQNQKHQPGTFIISIAYQLEAAFHAAGDIYLCRFTPAQISVFATPVDSDRKKQEAAARKNEQAHAILVAHLQSLNFTVRPGLYAQIQDIQSVAHLDTLYTVTGAAPIPLDNDSDSPLLEGERSGVRS